MTGVLRIRQMVDDDWPGVAEIYRLGIETGDATFETTVPTFEEWSASHLPQLSFVAIDEDTVAGWVAAVPVSDRCVYQGVVEHSVYVHPHFARRGIGRRLLETLIRATEDAGIWTIQSGIFPENAASLALHASCGFREIGIRRRVGRLGDRWRDVILLERRSDVVGV